MWEEPEEETKSKKKMKEEIIFSFFRIICFGIFWSICHDVSIKCLEMLLSMLSYDYYGPQGERSSVVSLSRELRGIYLLL